jgi:hypothetical protein
MEWTKDWGFRSQRQGHFNVETDLNDGKGKWIHNRVNLDERISNKGREIDHGLIGFKAHTIHSSERLPMQHHCPRLSSTYLPSVRPSSIYLPTL